jgi:hypothetical protein
MRPGSGREHLRHLDIAGVDRLAQQLSGCQVTRLAVAAGQRLVCDLTDEVL